MNLHFEPIKRSQVVSVPGYCVWCGSMVRTDDGKCHLFVSMWEEKYGFEYGWATHSKIGYAVADEPDGKYQFKGIILSGSGVRDGWDRDSVHNPYAIYHDGKFYIYYSGNYGDGEYKVHTSNQNVGIACATDPMGKWTRFDKPLLERRPGQLDASGSTNPSIIKKPDGTFMMLYKCWSHEAPFYGAVHITTAFAKHPLGPWERMDNIAFDVPGIRFPAEDPCPFYYNGKYYCILHENGNYYIQNEFRTMILFESKDGIKWQPSEPLLFLNRTLDFEEYGSYRLFRMERPFLYFENGKPKVFFTGIRPKNSEEHAYNVHMNVSDEDNK